MEIKTKLSNTKNYYAGRSSTIKYIVIHYTGNKGDTALNNADYFANNNVGVSANYFVDENDVYLSVRETDTACHCGGARQSQTGGAYYGKCTNSNSIGVEMCLWDKNGNVRERVITKAVELTKYLMKQFNISTNNVIRHWDVTGKLCPQPFVGDNNAYWTDFKKRITEEEIDMEELKKLEATVNALSKSVDSLSKNFKTYNDIASVPEWAKSTVEKLCEKKLLLGDGNGLNLSQDLLRTFVVLDRCGIFD